jgi:hypothetical protein
LRCRCSNGDAPCDKTESVGVAAARQIRTFPESVCQAGTRCRRQRVQERAVILGSRNGGPDIALPSVHCRNPGTRGRQSRRQAASSAGCATT